MRTRSHGKVGLVALLGGALALTGPSVAAAADLIEGGTLARGAGGDAITLRIDTAKLRLRSAVIGFTAACDNGGHYFFHTPLRTIVPSAGTLGVSPPGDALMLESLKPGVLRATLLRSESVGQGRTAGISLTLRGTLGRGQSKGTLSAAIQVVGSDGAQVAACRTGTVRWSTVHDPGHVFAGATSQGEPVVLWTNAKRTKLVRAAVGWHAGCEPQGVWDYPDELVNFPLSRSGAFGDTFTWVPEGTTAKFAYAFSGRITKTKASGRLQVTFTHPDGTACPTGPLTWRADSR